VEKRITNLVATHYPELKAFAHATPGVVNASMEFDLKTLKPTYNLIIGLPGRSNALAIAERLGLSADIIQSARSLLDPTDIQADDLLDEIHHQRTIARKARGAADRAKFEADQIRRELAQRLEKIEDERLSILENARTQQEKEIESLSAEVETLRKALARAHQPLDALKAVQERVEELQAVVEPPVVRRVVQSAAPRALKPGDKVRLRTLNMEGVVSAIGEDDLEVLIGSLRVRARLSDAVRAGQPEAGVEAQPTKSQREQAADRIPALEPFTPSPGVELDLRGQRAEDALEAVERYLESAYLSGMPYVRIIHGKGTGRLRQVIRESLSRSEFVSNWESGGETEGGDGVTVARIAKE
jgi:DNA mismatch repair protein MutS2